MSCFSKTHRIEMSDVCIFYCSHPSMPRLEFWIDLVPFDYLNYVFLFLHSADVMNRNEILFLFRILHVEVGDFCLNFEFFS